ncbi:MAG: sensor histidine kinase [Oribacterium sp.]
MIRSHLKLRTQILLTTFLTIGILLGIVTITLYDSTQRTIENEALASFAENVQKTSDILDVQLDIIREASEKLNLDTRLFALFKNLNVSDELALKRASQEVTSILRDFIPWYSDIYSAHLVTSTYRFGAEGLNYYPDFSESEIAQKAYEAGGRCVWIPTYSYTKMYHIENIDDANLPYGKLFSVARYLNLNDISSGRVDRLSSYTENPVLVVNFQPQYMKRVLTKYNTNGILEDAEYYILDDDCTIVYCTDEDYEAGAKYPETLLKNRQFGENGESFVMKENGRKYICSCSKSTVTDWNVVMKIPVSGLIGDIQKRYMLSLVVAFGVMVVVLAAMSVLLANSINQKIYSVIGVIKRIGEGEFRQKIDYNEKDEFSFFYKKIEKMGDAIVSLIHENYEVKLMQKDTEIKALNAQLNPHFIYNTLNIINWTCLDGDMQATSKMLVYLSRMLQYSCYHSGIYETLKDDMEWMERYLYIMRIRYADKFDVKVDIPEELLTMKVPKLFLQPFVENALVHGFKNLQEDGMLEISAECEGNTVIFYVEDNGCGMTEDKIHEILENDSESIGTANVNQRIKIIYGKEYGVEYHSQLNDGTMVIIRIPRTVPAEMEKSE